MQEDKSLRIPPIDPAVSMATKALIIRLGTRLTGRCIQMLTRHVVAGEPDIKKIDHEMKDLKIMTIFLRSLLKEVAFHERLPGVGRGSSISVN